MSNEIITKLCKFAFASTVIGVCTAGICPAFSIMGIAVGLVFRIKNVELDNECSQKIRYSYILGAVGLVCFVVDIVLMWIFLRK